MIGNFRVTIKSLYALALAPLACPIAAHAKGVQEALSDLASVYDTQPQAFTLMVVSIALLVTLACTLMIVTATYAFKRRPKSSSE
jgi:hypothetical protein